MNKEFEEKVFAYLIDLRDSGVTNMFGASPFIAKRFGIPSAEANELLAKWMRSFRR